MALKLIDPPRHQAHPCGRVRASVRLQMRCYTQA